MARSLQNQPEVFVSTAAMSPAVSRACRRQVKEADDIQAAVTVLTRTNAVLRPEEGDEQGIRLRIPDAADLAPDSG